MEGRGEGRTFPSVEVTSTSLQRSPRSLAGFMGRERQESRKGGKGKGEEGKKEVEKRKGNKWEGRKERREEEMEGIGEGRAFPHFISYNLTTIDRVKVGTSSTQSLYRPLWLICMRAVVVSLRGCVSTSRAIDQLNVALGRLRGALHAIDSSSPSFTRYCRTALDW